MKVRFNFHPRQLFHLFVKAGKAWVDDYAPSMGAAISYYTVFSLAPLLVIVIAIAGAVFGRDAVEGTIVSQLGGLIGQQGATMIQGLLANASDTDKGLVAGLISAVVLLVGATTVFAELQSALDRIWHVPEAQKPKGIWAILRARVLSFGLILGLVFLLVVSLAVSAALSAFGDWMTGLMPGAGVLLQLANFVVSLAIMTVLFGMIYKLMPSTHMGWEDVWVGGFTTAVLFDLGKLLIGIYIGKSNMTESFQAAGSLVVLLAWVYYAAQVFLLGAEFTKVFSETHGTKAAHPQVAASAAAPSKAPVPAAQPALAAGAAPRLVETPASQVRHLRDHNPWMEGPAIRASGAGLNAALTRLVTEVLALVVVSAAGAVLHKKRERVQTAYGWGGKRRQKKRAELTSEFTSRRTPSRAGAASIPTRPARSRGWRLLR